MTEVSGAGERGDDSQPRRRTRPHYEGDPTILKVMLRLKWIAALVLALAVAGGFAWLGQWQLENAIRIDHQQTIDSEAVRALAEVNEPGAAVTDTAAGMVVEVTGRFVPGDFTVIENRANGGEVGAWLAGHLVTDGSNGAPVGHLAVAIGWAADVRGAERALERFEADHAGGEFELEGRYMPGDGAVRPEASDDPGRVLSMAPAQLVNLWQPFAGLSFAGYLVLHPADTVLLADLGLDAIDSVPPLPVETINWVSLFYALEWIVFAGFAVFFWYRLVRDDWEKTHELQQLRAADPSPLQ